MFRSRSRLARSIFFSFLWFALRIPTDIILYRCTKTDLPMLENAIALQVADALVACFLVYRIIAEQINRAHKCPTCKGRKKLYGDDAIFLSVPADSLLLRTAATCPTCVGLGYIWERSGGTN